MRKTTRKSKKACIWTKTAIMSVRAIFVGLASALTLIAVYGLKKAGI